MAELKVLTTGEAAKYCGVNFRTVIRWIERGQLEAYKLPGRGDHRIRVEDFVAFLRNNGMPVPAELGTGNRRVLVIEEQPEMASAIRRVLIQAGYEVDIAADAFSAGMGLGGAKPAVVTLNFRMPGLNAYQVLDSIRSRSEFANTRVLVVADEQDPQLGNLLEQGADAVLAKPFAYNELEAKVRLLLDD